jgi:uncharacterized LabA/DUF88 family protein
MDEPANSSSASRRLAMLVDGDNAQASLTEGMLAEASKYGLVSIRRVYGDWTTPSMNTWKDTLQQFAMQPIQQFSNTVGKNATDSALIIDAMDILYSQSVGGFCIVSSDSDYTRLATRIRETGAFVMGIGRSITPKAFVNACDIFVFTEIIAKQEPHKGEAPEVEESEVPTPVDPVPLLSKAYKLAARDDGFAFLGSLGHYLRQLDPSFDPRSYGHSQLSMLIKRYPDLFEIREDKTAEGPIHMWVRLKE